MTIDEAIEQVQFAYPQVYYHCHTRHARRRSNTAEVSSRDGEILVHLGRDVPTGLSDLARHMDLARSTVSEAVTKLERFGYIAKRAHRSEDRRHVGLVLTARGVEAVRATSVLEAARLRAVLMRLPERQRTAAVKGLARLADACRPSTPLRAGRRTPR